MDIKELKSFIETNLKTETGSNKSARFREYWFRNNGYEKEFSAIYEYTSFLPKDSKLGIIVWHVMNEMKRVPSSKCHIDNVSIEEEKKFLNENHIYGYTKSFYRVGLFHNSDLVSLLTIRKPFNRGSEVEIARFATSLNTIVNGAFGKLLSSVKKWMKDNGYYDLITYADLRFSTHDNVYSKFMTYEKDTEPGYYYTDGRRKFNRFKFRATKDKTEKEIASENGVNRIYDCGHAKYRLTLDH